MVGDHVQGLVQIAVGGGVTDLRAGWLGMQVGAVARPAQRDLSMHGGRALSGRAIQPLTAFMTGAGTCKRARWATASSRGRGVESLARSPCPREPILHPHFARQQRRM